MERALGVLIGGVLGIIVFIFVILPLLEKYIAPLLEKWYDIIDKWAKK
jgi:hypothetical protein